MSLSAERGWLGGWVVKRGEDLGHLYSLDMFPMYLFTLLVH